MGPHVLVFRLRSWTKVIKVTAAAVEELEGLNAWLDTVSGAAGHCEQTSTCLHVLIVKATQSSGRVHLTTPESCGNILHNQNIGSRRCRARRRRLERSLASHVGTSTTGDGSAHRMHSVYTHFSPY